MTVTAVVLLACFVPAVLMAQTNPAAAAARLASAARARYRWWVRHAAIDSQHRTRQGQHPAQRTGDLGHDGQAGPLAAPL